MHELSLKPSEIPFLDLYRLVNRIMHEESLGPEEREGLLSESYRIYCSITVDGAVLTPGEYRAKLEETAANRLLIPANAEDFVFELLKRRG